MGRLFWVNHLSNQSIPPLEGPNAPNGTSGMPMARSRYGAWRKAKSEESRGIEFQSSGVCHGNCRHPSLLESVFLCYLSRYEVSWMHGICPCIPPASALKPNTTYLPTYLLNADPLSTIPSSHPNHTERRHGAHVRPHPSHQRVWLHHMGGPGP